MADDIQEPEWDTTEAEESLQQQESPTPAQEPMDGGGDSEPSRVVLEQFKARGYDTSGYDSDEDFLADLEQGYVETNRYRSTISEYEANRDAFEQWRQSQSQPKQDVPAQVSETEEPPKPKYAPPQVSDTARQLLQSGVITADARSGMFKSSDPGLQRYADELTKEAQWSRAQAQKLINNPRSFFEETGILEEFKPQDLNRDELKQELLKEIKAELAAQHQQQTVAQELNQYLPALYQMQNGQVARNAAGEPIPTQLGQYFNHALGQAEAYGIQDQQTKVRFAMDQIRPYLEQQNQQQQEEQPTQQERRQEQQDTFIERAKRNGKKQQRLSDRDASIAEEAAREATQNDYVNDDMLWQKAKQDAEAQMV